MFTTPYSCSIVPRISQRTFAICLTLLTIIFLSVSSVKDSKAQSNDKLVLIWAAPDDVIVRNVAWGDWDNDGDLDLASGTRVYENDAGTLKLDPANGFGWNGGEHRYSVAWGDWDNDGDLDLAADAHVYENDSGTLKLDPANGFGWDGDDRGYSVAWGDWDNDGDLDLASGARVYENDGGTLKLDPTNGFGWDGGDRGYSVAWGDWDNDGDLDLAIGDDFYNGTSVYENDGGALKLDPINGLGWNSDNSSYSVTWSDWDNDGDLDLGVGGWDGIIVYENDRSTLKLDTTNGFGWQIALYNVSAIAWGDWDNDGDSDLAIAQGGDDIDPQFNKVYENTANGLILAWSSPIETNTINTAWGDWDNDGDLDLAFVDQNFSGVHVYENRLVGIKRIWASPDINGARSLAWGDWDSDGDLDLAVGCTETDFSDNPNTNQVYENRDNSLLLAWEAPANDCSRNGTHNLAWGDWDNDGDLDLVVGQEKGPLRIYENAGKTLKLDPVNGFGWEGGTSSRNLDWGDWDGDGDLDLATADDNTPTSIYENDQGVLILDPARGWGWEGDKGSSSVAWGDWDSDGDLDLAVGYSTGISNKVYENISGHLNLAWVSPYTENTTSIAWADWNSDGDLDLAVANKGGRTQVFDNQDHNLLLVWSSTQRTYAHSVAWGDWDGDGDLDLAVGNTDPDDMLMQSLQIYQNTGDGLELRWSSPLAYNGFWGIAFGDWDNDGNLELATASAYDFVSLYTLQRSIIVTKPKVQVRRPGCDAASFFSCGQIIDTPVVPINYTIYGDVNDPIRLIKAYYSLDNGSHWHPAVATNNTLTTKLAASPTGNQYVYYWDIYASNIFGASDSVLFRLDVSPGFKQPGPYQYAFYPFQTLPFRLRGSQVRVVNNLAQPVSNAIVQRLPAQQTSDYIPYNDHSGKPYVTNLLGYLQGYGEIRIGDQLLAMQPIASSSVYTIYQTNAIPTANGLAAHTVTSGGVQTLAVSPAHTLILFNLIISLEWDARNDTTFMAQLENDLRRTSQILYDLTNGQAALGNVRIYHDKGFWGEANVVIQANNNQRPSAIMGGIVLTGTADIDIKGQHLPDAYVPGQVRMGPSWNRFGNPDGTLGEDWPRALAHELGHYLFFQADDYVGITPNGQFTLINCAGSNMADPYEDSDSEFLTRAQWTGDCLNTVANRYLGRADWESIIHFYPMLNGTTTNPGPSQLPLAVTQIEIFAPVTPTTALAAPFFHLVDNTNNALSVPEGRGQAYLIKTRSNNDPTDDYVIAEGTPVGDLVQARGAAPGDRLCVFDYSHSPLRLGCNTVTSTAGAVILQDTPGWAPQLQVVAVTSNTLAITVTNVTETNLNVQLLPALGIASAEVQMMRIGNRFVQTVTAADGAFYGFIRIWAPGSNPLKEMISEYTAVEAWHGRSYAWGGRSYAWGGRSYAWGGRSYAWGGRSYAWGAPVMSGDGQASIFPLDNLFGSGTDYTLQTMAFPPRLPAWLTQVGQAYQVNGHGTSGNSAILFRYLARDVPAGYEAGLRVYYSPDAGATWQRLATQLDIHSNQASAALQGDGIYLLAATVEVQPAFTPGWNLFGYPVQQAQPASTALASIAGRYTVAYAYDVATQQWTMYAPTVPAPFSDLVNTLHQLDYAHSYWVYATQPVTLYLGVGSTSPGVFSSNVEKATNGNSPLAPALYYGSVTAADGFTPAIGMRVRAEIDGVTCGETTIQALGGQLVYVLAVPASAPSGPVPNCGAVGKEVTFKIGDQTMAQHHAWNNSQAWLHSLGGNPPTGNSLYLPLIRR